MTRDKAKDLAWQTIRANTEVIQQIISIIDAIYDAIETEEK